MGRNHKKEAEWKKTVYSQVNFQVKKELAAEYRAHLMEHGISAVEWFKYAVSLKLVPSAGDTHMSTKAKFLIDDKKTSVHETLEAQHKLKCVRCGFVNDRLNVDFANGYFKCVECEFGNYEPIEEEAECSIEHDENITLDAETSNTHMSKMMWSDLVDAESGNLSEELKPKKKRAVSPTAEMVEEWRKMKDSGMSFVQIAAVVHGYDASTIRKRVRGRGTAAN